MDEATTINLLVFGGPVLAIVIVGTMLALVDGARPDPKLRAQQRAAGAGQWFARRHPGFQWGVLRIEDARLSFTLDGETVPAWSVPARSLTVSGPGLIGAYLDFRGPEIDRFYCQVSSSKGARWREAGDVRGLHDKAVAEDIVEILLGHGAQRA